MVPEMTDDEKAILWGRMGRREDALAAWSDGQIVKIFKKYKVRNEFSIDYFGYGYQKWYEAWAKASAELTPPIPKAHACRPCHYPSIETVSMSRSMLPNPGLKRQNSPTAAANIAVTLPRSGDAPG